MDLIGNKFFDIVQLDEELLKTQKDRIFNLMKELESAHEKDYRQQKIKDMEKYIKDKSAIIFVALDSGKIIGYIWGYVRYNSQFPRVHITQFVVNPDYRSHGIGENLLKHIEDWAQTNGYNEIELKVSANNYGGIHFYDGNKFIKKDIFMIKRLTQEINEDINLGGECIDMRLVNGNVTLRAIEKSDNDVLRELINDPEVEEKVAGWSFPISDEKQMQWYQSIVSNNNKDRVRYAVEVDGECVGMAALHDIDYKNSHAGVDIKLIKSARGQGIGSAVINSLVKYAFDELNLHCLIADILEDNEGSRKLFEKCGFKMEGRLKDRIYKGGRYHDQCVYSILRT